MTSVLAMIYLVLISMLAVGFYVASDNAMLVSQNERRTDLAQAACESGMSYMHYHLAQLKVPHGTPQASLLAEVCSQLKDRVDGTPNLAGKSITTDGTSIFIPGDTKHFINLDNNGAGFRCILHRSGSRIVVKVIGRHGGSGGARAVQMAFDIKQNFSPIFNFGVASRSAVSLNSNAKITGSTPQLGALLITTNTVPALTLLSNASISGDVSFSTPTPTYNISSSATIAGLTTSHPGFAEHIHTHVEEPEFPTIDTNVFRAYAGNPIYGGIIIPMAPGIEMKYEIGPYRNILIKANPNPSSKIVFAGDATIDGIIYIETPNKVKFDGNVVIRGCIVVENNPKGSYSGNTIEFTSNSKIQPIDTLPDTDPRFPPPLQALTGSAILAPSFEVLMNSNFGAAGGSMIADKIKFDSNAIGSIIGSVVNLKDTAVSMDGNAKVTIQTAGAGQFSSGVFFSKHYSPVPSTYEEVKP